MDYEKIRQLVKAAQPMTILEDRLVIPDVLDHKRVDILEDERYEAIEQFLKEIGRTDSYWTGVRRTTACYVYFSPILTEDELENELRNIERDEITLAKEKMLANNTITIPRDANRLSELTTGAGKWETKRFTHLEWVENKGGRTYTVKGYCDLARWERGAEQHFEHFKVKKSYLQSAIDDAYNVIARYERELAAETVSA